MAARLGGTFKHRHDIALLIKPNGVGAELGVAAGAFSERLLSHPNLGRLYSIDMWAGDRGHDAAQYREAVGLLEKHRDRNTILRMLFDEALPLFPMSISISSTLTAMLYTGEEAGQTLRRPGGRNRNRAACSAGDDYSPEWPLVVHHVNEFAAKVALDVMLPDPAVKGTTKTR